MIALAKCIVGMLAAWQLTGAVQGDSGLPPLAPDASLPATLREAHSTCAGPGDSVTLASGTFGPGVVFRVGCPRDPVSSWPRMLAPRYDLGVPITTPVRVYIARDKDGTGAQPVRFPVRLADGSTAFVSTLPISALAERAASADPARAVPWIEALWKPANRDDMCKIKATWRIKSGKAELWRWSEAKICTNDGPQYRIILNHHPPKLVAQ
jgi:hypothetical protein